MNIHNKYTIMQKGQYYNGTSNHLVHNDNPDYWDILLGDLKKKEFWKNKKALDFACGKGRNVTNMISLCDWNRVDGIDLSLNNIAYCMQNYKDYPSRWYCNNGIDVRDLKSNEYDFIMSTIALQHIPVYDIRKNLLTDLLRVLKPGGLFSFQMGFGKDLKDIFGRAKSGYYDNSWDASGTNSIHDVRVQDEQEVISDLKKIGFESITTTVKEIGEYDAGHSHWIYVKCYKGAV